MNYLSKLTFVVTAGCIVLTGCATNPNKQDVGTVLGGATGAILGSQVGGGSGRVAATVIGALAGGWIGNRIGAGLDENDRNRLYEDSRRTAETGRPYSFYNERSGVKGRTEVVRNETIDRRQCRVIQQTVISRDGRETTENVRTCRGSNGWETY